MQIWKLTISALFMAWRRQIQRIWKVYCWWGNKVETGSKLRRIIFGVISAYIISMLLPLFLVISVLSGGAVVATMSGMPIIKALKLVVGGTLFVVFEIGLPIVGIGKFPQDYKLPIHDPGGTPVFILFVLFPPLLFLWRPNRYTCFGLAISMFAWRYCTFWE